MPELAGYARKLSRPVALDLFCGAGGPSLGLESTGFKVILGVDFDEHAIATHRAHFGGCSLQADLSDPAEIDRIIMARNFGRSYCGQSSRTAILTRWSEQNPLPCQGSEKA
jgi:DNA (cytosine-5)-methyltransferase 1